MRNRKNYFEEVASVKVLIALSNEPLNVIDLLYKITYLDLIDDSDKLDIKNVNRLCFYQKIIRKVLNRMYNLFYIKTDGKKIYMDIDGRHILEEISDNCIVRSLLSKSHETGSNKDYRELYLKTIEKYAECLTGRDDA